MGLRFCSVSWEFRGIGAKMSRSETGVMASRGEPFNNVGLQKNQLSPQPVIQNMRLAFSPDGTAAYKTISPTSPSHHSPNGVSGSGGVGSEVSAPGGCDSGSGINMNVGVGGERPVKKKRGRPRKYGPEGALPLALAPHAPQPVSGGGFSSPTSGGGASGEPASPNHKKSRGRPPGSSNKKHRLPLQPLGSSGSGFVPHVITVKAGEDVSSKIMSFLQHGSKALCILSANGAISNVTLRQAATSGGTVTYEGRFEILSLSGSFLLSEVEGQRSRTGGLSVSLSGPDGRVLGGGVAGLLTAASLVQIIVGSFNADGARNKEPKPAPTQPDQVFVPSKVSSGGGGVIGASSPAWDGTIDDSSGGTGSPLNHHGSGHGTNSGSQGFPWK